MKHDLPHGRSGGASVPRWNRLSEYFARQYGERVQKIPLDAGFSCPNRDGTLSSSGCLFCNPLGSGTGLGVQGLSIAEQWEKRCAKPRDKGVRFFIAYLQSFSNTHGPIERLEAVLEELIELPGLIGASIGTRPDCVDDAKLDCIARKAAERQWSECWIEYGVQSCNDATLERICRGHGIGCAEDAINAAVKHGIKVCIHLIAGLPGEDAGDLAKSVRWASRQPVSSVKFHCLYVCRNTALGEMFQRGEYTPWEQEDYVRAIADALPLLRPDIVVQRITGQPGPDELLAPEWASKGLDTGNKILARLASDNAWQGKFWR